MDRPELTDFVPDGLELARGAIRSHQFDVLFLAEDLSDRMRERMPENMSDQMSDRMPVLGSRTRG